MVGGLSLVLVLCFPLFCIVKLTPLRLVIMITYLHHTDPDLPHYRGKEWSFQRGAAATIDRNFLGWQGRFFLHDVAHFHVIHHVYFLNYHRLLFLIILDYSSSPKCLSVCCYLR